MWSSSLWLLVGCPPTGLDTDLGAQEPFPCTLGQGADGAFDAFAPGDPAELVLGFQGFLYVELVASAADPPPIVDAAMYVEVDGADPIDGAQPAVAFVAADAGALSEPMRLFFTSGSIGTWTGRSAHVAVRLEDGTRACVASADVVLADDEVD